MTAKILFNNLRRQTEAMRAELEAASRRVIKSGWFVLGEEGRSFEKEFAAYNNAQYAIGLANGSEALEIALKAVGVTAGQKVATVANAGGYSTMAIYSLGAKPLFIDVDPKKQLLDLASLKQALEDEEIASVIATHLYGCMVDMSAVLDLCRSRGIPVIEDCAQAHGAKQGGQYAGTLSALGCFSFYPTKNLGALGDGGAIVTNDKTLMERVKALRQYGWSTKYHIDLPGGCNSRLDEIQAAFLREKLKRLDQWNKRRREIAEYYTKAISNEQVICPPLSGDDYVAHLYVLRCKTRDALRAHLLSAGIDTDIHYPIPDHRQSGWHALESAKIPLPVTEQLAGEIISLPCYPELEDNEVNAIIAAVNSW